MKRRPMTPPSGPVESRDSGGIGRCLLQFSSPPAGARRKRRWQMSVILLLAALTLNGTGCQQLLHEFGYYRVLHKHRAWVAWMDSADVGTDADAQRHFGRGWRRGYADVAGGGDGLPPIVAPQCYWGKHGGERKAQSWFEGYHFGALAAEIQGAYTSNFVPTSPEFVPYYESVPYDTDDPVEVSRRTEDAQPSRISRTPAEPSERFETVAVETDPIPNGSASHRSDKPELPPQVEDFDARHQLVAEKHRLLVPPVTDPAHEPVESAETGVRVAVAKNSIAPQVRSVEESTKDPVESANSSASLFPMQIQPMPANDEPASAGVIHAAESVADAPPVAEDSLESNNDQPDPTDVRALAQQLYDGYVQSQMSHWQQKQTHQVRETDRDADAQEAATAQDPRTAQPANAQDLVKKLYAEYAAAQKKRWEQQQSGRRAESVDDSPQPESVAQLEDGQLETSETHALVQRLYEEYAHAHEQLWQQQTELRLRAGIDDSPKTDKQ